MAMVEDRTMTQAQVTGARMAQTSGLLAQTAPTGRMQAKGGVGRDDRDAMIAELEGQLRSLEDRYKFRISSFMKRETQTRNKIESLERRLNEGSDQDEHVQRMAVIENMHRSVVQGLESIQGNTSKILHEQEKELMRAFRAKLQETSKELEQQKSRRGEPSSELQARHKKVVAELHDAREMAQRFDRKNQQLDAENKKLLEKLRSQTDDRQSLLRDLVQAKKENARLKHKCQDVVSAPSGSPPVGKVPGHVEHTAARELESTLPKHGTSEKHSDKTRAQQMSNKQYEREVRYREAVLRMKRMVDAEQRTARSLRQQQAEVLQQRTEVEVFLRQCLEDVQAEISRYEEKQERHASSEQPTFQPGISSSVHEMNAQDRGRVLELLLSQQRVVQLLYKRALPQVASGDFGDSPASFVSDHGGNEDDLAWLGDMVPPEA